MQNVLILAGGESSRMGYPKSFLPFNDNFCFLENIVNTYSKLNSVSEIVVVLNSSFYLAFKDIIENLSLKCIFIPNDYPENGRMYSIKLGLNAFKDNLPTFIQNVDNPFVDYNSILSLSNIDINENEYLTLIVKKKPTHPILINKGIINFLKNDPSDCSLKDKLSKFKKIEITSDNELLLLNINTPADYQTYFDYFYDEFLI